MLKKQTGMSTFIFCLILTSCSTTPVKENLKVASQFSNRSVASGDEEFVIDLRKVRLNFKLATFVQNSDTGIYVEKVRPFSEKEIEQIFAGAKTSLVKEKFRGPLVRMDDRMRCSFNECPDTRYTYTELPIDFKIRNGEVTVSGSTRMTYKLKRNEGIEIMLNSDFRQDLWCDRIVDFDIRDKEVREVVCRKVTDAKLTKTFVDANLNFDLRNEFDYYNQNLETIYEVGVFTETDIRALAHSIRLECEGSEKPKQCQNNHEAHPNFRQTLKEPVMIKIRERTTSKIHTVQASSIHVWVGYDVAQPINVEFKNDDNKTIFSIAYYKNHVTGLMEGSYYYLHHPALKSRYKMIESRL